MQNITIAGAQYTNVPSVLLPKTSGGSAEFFDTTGATATAADVLNGKTFYSANGLETGIGTGGGGAPILGVLRSDAELVDTWKYDGMLVADEGLSIPVYSTSNQTIRAGQNIATYEGDPLTYRYIIVERCLTIPYYTDGTAYAKGREEYVFSVSVYEWVYHVAGQLRTLDGTKTYGQYSQMLAAGPVSREVYWSSATAVSVYTSGAYCLNQALVSPTVASNKTITIKSPQIAIRGHATYLAQTFFEAITDARLQYIIELWRVPVEQGVINGWAYTSLTDRVLDDIANNGGTLT